MGHGVSLLFFNVPWWWRFYSLWSVVCEYLSSLSFEFWKGEGVKEFQMDLKGTPCVAELFQHLQCNFIFPLFLILCWLVWSAFFKLRRVLWRVWKTILHSFHPQHEKVIISEMLSIPTEHALWSTCLTCIAFWEQEMFGKRTRKRTEWLILMPFT